jgi:hypothetical protein
MGEADITALSQAKSAVFLTATGEPAHLYSIQMEMVQNRQVFELVETLGHCKDLACVKSVLDLLGWCAWNNGEVAEVIWNDGSMVGILVHIFDHANRRGRNSRVSNHWTTLFHSIVVQKSPQIFFFFLYSSIAHCKIYIILQLMDVVDSALGLVTILSLALWTSHPDFHQLSSEQFAKKKSWLFFFIFLFFLP